MYINVRKEMDFNDLANECWSGAENTFARIEEEGKEEKFINLLNEYFYCGDNSIDNAPDLSEIDDLLRFDSNWVLEQLDIDPIKKYDIDDLSGEPYYRALENYLNAFPEYDEKNENFRSYLLNNIGSSATGWSIAAIRRLKESINENGVVFDVDGNLIDN